MVEAWNVAVLVGEGVAPFELGVACEVFGTDRSEQGLPVHDFALCAPAQGKLRTKSGFHIEPTHPLDRLLEADLVVVPPIDDPPPPKLHSESIGYLRAAAEGGAWIAGLCSGVFVLAQAGLLDGRTTAVHWHAAPTFQRTFPHIDIDQSVLYMADPPVFTSAGTGAAIDLCLHLVRRGMGAQVANAVARRMVVPAHREGGQSQYIEYPVPSCTDDLHAVLVWMENNLEYELSVPELARKARMSPRTFARRFRSETGATPHQWLITQRVVRAQQLLETSGADLESVARLCGFGNATILRHHFIRRLGTTPTQYRRAFREESA